MWKPIYQPEPWPQFVKRKDIKGLPLMEQRKKFLEEQILFENYLSTLNTVNTVSTVSAGAAGGPAPGSGGSAPPQIKVKIDTNFKPTGSVWDGNDFYGAYQNDVPSTQVLVAFTDNSVFNTNANYNVTSSPPNDNFTPPSPRTLTIDWGDGTVETPTDFGKVLNKGGQSYLRTLKHDYATDGEYTITFTGTATPWVSFRYLPIVDILQYDLSYLSKRFTGGVGLFGQVSIDGYYSYNPFLSTFWSGYSENPTLDIASWDVSNINAFFGTFAGSEETWYQILGMTDQNPDANPDLFTFNEDVSGWDMSNAQSIVMMFAGQGYFSQNLGSWDVSNAKELYGVFKKCTRLMSGARADLWDVSSVDGNTIAFACQFTSMFEGAMTDISVVGSMPHIGNWRFDGFPDGKSDLLYNTFKDSGFSHTAIGQSLIGWASQSALPINIGVHTGAFANTFNGTYSIGGGPNFSNPSYNLTTTFGAEVKATYDYLTSPAADGSTTTLTVTTTTAKGDQERYAVNGYNLGESSLVNDFTFLIGNTYRFDQSDASNTGHPLRFSTTIDGTHGGGNEYVTGVTIVGTPGTSGSYSEITVTGNTASPLYVYCPNHAGYGLGYTGGNPRPLTMNEGGKGWTIPGFTFTAARV